MVNGSGAVEFHFPMRPSSGPPGVATTLKYLAVAGLASATV